MCPFTDPPFRKDTKVLSWAERPGEKIPSETMTASFFTSEQQGEYKVNHNEAADKEAYSGYQRRQLEVT